MHCHSFLQVPWDDKNCVVQTIRAAYNYYPVKKSGKLHPWHDNIAVQSPEPNVEWYSQLRLLFKWGDKNLALVRWYEVMQEPDILTRFDCTRVKWEDVGIQNQPRYQVIELDTVIRRVFVVEDFNPIGDIDSFHISAFKWDRTVPDKRGIRDKNDDLGLDGDESDRSEEDDASSDGEDD